MSTNNLTDAEMEKLEACKTEAEWDATCDEIKRARGGDYPPDWFAKVVLAGLGQMKDAEIKILKSR